MIQTINATQAREKFADIINRVLYREEEFIIEKQGKPVALITKVKKNKKIDNKRINSKQFFAKLSHYQLKKGPKNFAKNHDKYAWDTNNS